MGSFLKSVKQSAPKTACMHVQVIQYMGAGGDDVETYWGLQG